MGTSDAVPPDDPTSDAPANERRSINDRFLDGGWNWKLRLIFGTIVLVLAAIAYLRDW